MLHVFAMAGSDVKDTITKLGSSNYYAWSCQMQALLDSKDWWDTAVEEGWTEEELEDCSQAEKRVNKNALALIKRSVEDHHLETIGELKSAKEAWDALKELFVVTDESQQLMMMKSFIRMEKDHKTPVADYINKVVAAHRELSETGLISFNNRTVALIVLMGLPDEYKDIVRTAMRDPKLSVKTLIPVLKAEELRLKMEREERNAKSFLFKRQNNVQQPNFSQANQSDADRRECYACHKPGHVANQCPKVLGAKSRGTVLCYSCGREGHASTSSFCPNNKSNSYSNSGSANNQSGGNNRGGANSGPSGSRNSGGGNNNNGAGPNGPNTPRSFKNNEARVDMSENVHEIKVGGGAVRVKYAALMVNVRADQESDNEVGDASRWCLDSGCNAHCTPHRELIENFRETEGVMTVAKKNEPCAVKGVGSVTMKLLDEFGGYTLLLSEVYWVPDSSDNLVSVRQLEKRGIKFTIDNGVFSAYNKANGEEILCATVAGSQDDLYMFYVDYYVQECNADRNESVSGVKVDNAVSISANKVVTKEIWHKRFAHANNLPSKDFIPRGKANKLPYPDRPCRSEKILDLVFSDECIVQPETKNGSKCFITFTDDCTRYCKTFVLMSKSESFNAFVAYKSKTENFQSRRIKAFQTDNGREYINKVFERVIEECGIKHRKSVPGAHGQMGISERQNRTLLTMARCMLIESGLPDDFWGEAVMTACYIRNRCESRAIENQIPFELWHNRKLSSEELRFMKVFGCQAWMTVENVKSHKMKDRAEECVMIGYPDDRRGYRLWHLEKKRVFESRDVRFCEDVLPMRKGKISASLVNETNSLVYLDSGWNDDCDNDDEEEKEDEVHEEEGGETGERERER